MRGQRKYFWEDYDLMNWLSDERWHVYEKYMDRALRRFNRLSLLDQLRFRRFLERMADEAERSLRALERLVSKQP